MERGQGRGPDRGPRKRYGGKIAGSKAEKAVKKCLLNGGTLAEASRLVTRIDGKSVSKQSVSRYYRRLLEAAERTQMMDSLARALAGSSAPASGRNVGGTVRRMLLARALEAAACLPEDAMESLAPDRLALLVCRLTRAEAEADRHRWEAYERDYADNHSRERDLGKKAEAGPPLSLAERLGDLLKGFGGPSGPDDAPDGTDDEPDGAAEEPEAGAP